MSIFASTSRPTLISIPTFTSPVHPQNGDQNDSTIERGSPTKALTRAEERQKRFRNANTQWDSLTRMIEQQKANNSHSLLQLIGGSSTVSTTKNGKAKGKEMEGRVERRKSTRGGSEATKGTSKDVSRAVKGPSPQQRKRETSKLEGKSDSVGMGGEKQSRGDGLMQKGTVEVLPQSREQGESSDRGGKSGSKSTNSLAPPVQPLPSSPAPLFTSRDSSTTFVPTRPKGRAPRAAIRRPLEIADTQPATSNSLVPASRSPPRLSTVPSPAPRSIVIPDAVPLDNSKPVEAPKRRRKPRAAPPTPAASRHRKPSLEPEDRCTRAGSIEVIPDSQVEADPGLKGKEKEEIEIGSEKATGTGKKRKVVADTAVDVGEDAVKESSPKKKIKVVEDTRSKSKVSVERGVNRGKEAELIPAREPRSTKQRKEPTEIATSTDKKGKKKATSKAVVPSPSPPSSSPPLKKATKRSRPVVTPPSSSSPVVSPVHPSTSSQQYSVPPLLSSPTTSKPTLTKGKAKQHLVQSERLETDYSQEGKVNVYDVIIGGAKSALKDVLEDLDEDHEKISALKHHVAGFRLSLLNRSADLSEYSALQRKLTSTKARSKKLKAELEELKKEKKGK